MTDPDLTALAALHGVATSYQNWRGEHVDVPARTLIAVLAAMDVDASTPEARRAATEAAQSAEWRQLLPPTVIQVSGEEGTLVRVHCRHGEPVELSIHCADGSVRTDIEQVMVWVDPVEVDGTLRGAATFRLPADLPLGWHELSALAGAESARSTLVVVPARAPINRLGDDRAWGLAVQLYAARSVGSWAIGDFGDLAALVQWTSEQGGDFVLVSPVHATATVPPIEPSPYYPATRRFAHPIYLRVEDMPEYAAAGWGTRQRIAELREDAIADEADRIDRDRIWVAKRAAFALLWPIARRDAVRRADLDDYRAQEGEALEQFATWCALVERYGRDSDSWPTDALGTEDLADRIAFYCWLQLCCSEQLSSVQRAATRLGMRIGVMHDLPVGVDPGGADVWASPDVFAAGVTVGAPADAFNQQGQDWQQPAWRPDRLAQTGYAAYRELLRNAFRHAGALRIDHVLGLFRLWWIPAGNDAADGTYVRYDADAMLGILALEAQLAGAIVVGEDLGTVEPGVRDVLAERQLLGSTVLWFESDDAGRPHPPEQWRELSMATATTHDLPTVTGLLALAHVDLRARLGLLTRPVEEERAAAARARDGWLGLARERGLLDEAAASEEQLLALHALLAQSSCRLVGVAYADLARDPRQPNQPGTVDSYPNWCLPTATAVGADGPATPALLADVLADERAEKLVQVIRRWVGPRAVE